MRTTVNVKSQAQNHSGINRDFAMSRVPSKTPADDYSRPGSHADDIQQACTGTLQVGASLTQQGVGDASADEHSNCPKHTRGRHVQLNRGLRSGTCLPGSVCLVPVTDYVALLPTCIHAAA